MDGQARSSEADANLKQPKGNPRCLVPRMELGEHLLMSKEYEQCLQTESQSLGAQSWHWVQSVQALIRSPMYSVYSLPFKDVTGTSVPHKA